MYLPTCINVAFLNIPSFPQEPGDKLIGVQDTVDEIVKYPGV